MPRAAVIRNKTTRELQKKTQEKKSKYLRWNILHVDLLFAGGGEEQNIAGFGFFLKEIVRADRAPGLLPLACAFPALTSQPRAGRNVLFGAVEWRNLKPDWDVSRWHLALPL
jgi:hypothetical protein